MNYLGIDHHRQYSCLTFVDEKGNILSRFNEQHLRQVGGGKTEGGAVRLIIDL
jgi:hypothetical protein